jgi:hypothetical protein
MPSFPPKLDPAQFQSANPLLADQSLYKMSIPFEEGIQAVDPSRLRLDTSFLLEKWKNHMAPIRDWHT